MGVCRNLHSDRLLGLRETKFRLAGLRRANPLNFIAVRITTLSRLILIEGPQSGEFFKLRGKNYLGKDDIQLTFSYSQKRKEKKAFICRTDDDYKITNLDPNEELLVDGGR